MPLSRELGHLAARLGEWALLLKLVNGFLRERVIDAGEALREALVDAETRLDEEGLVAFDAEDEDDRTKAVARTINVSLGLLDPARRARFAELSVFPQDADIPVGMVAGLWRRTAGLGERATKDLLSRFYGLSLLLDLDLTLRTLRFHDTIRHFLRDQAGDEGLVAGHVRLLDALDAAATSAHTDGPSRKYYFLHLPDHLSEAKQRDRLDGLLLDPGWLKEKLAATGSPQALIADYDRHAVGDMQTLIGRTLRLSAGICTRDPRQLIPQLLGRLMARGGTQNGFLEAARLQLSCPALLALRPTMTTPGAEIGRLEGHSEKINALCVLPDGRLASGAGSDYRGSSDNTIRLWDVKAGAETARLSGALG